MKAPCVELFNYFYNTPFQIVQFIKWKNGKWMCIMQQTCSSACPMKHFSYDKNLFLTLQVVGMGSLIKFVKLKDGRGWSLRLHRSREVKFWTTEE